MLHLVLPVACGRRLDDVGLDRDARWLDVAGVCTTAAADRAQDAGNPTYGSTQRTNTRAQLWNAPLALQSPQAKQRAHLVNLDAVFDAAEDAVTQIWQDSYDGTAVLSRRATEAQQRR